MTFAGASIPLSPGPLISIIFADAPSFDCVSHNFFNQHAPSVLQQISNSSISRNLVDPACHPDYKNHYFPNKLPGAHVPGITSHLTSNQRWLEIPAAIVRWCSPSSLPSYKPPFTEIITYFTIFFLWLSHIFLWKRPFFGWFCYDSVTHSVTHRTRRAQRPPLPEASMPSFDAARYPVRDPMILGPK